MIELAGTITTESESPDGSKTRGLTIFRSRQSVTPSKAPTERATLLVTPRKDAPSTTTFTTTTDKLTPSKPLQTRPKSSIGSAKDERERDESGDSDDGDTPRGSGDESYRFHPRILTVSLPQFIGQKTSKRVLMAIKTWTRQAASATATTESAPVVASISGDEKLMFDGVLVTLNQRGDQESYVCLTPTKLIYNPGTKPNPQKASTLLLADLKLHNIQTPASATREEKDDDFDDDDTAQDLLDIPFIETSPGVQVFIKTHPYSFQISSIKESLVLSAATKSQKSHWLRLLEQVLAKAKRDATRNGGGFYGMHGDLTLAKHNSDMDLLLGKELKSPSTLSLSVDEKVFEVKEEFIAAQPSRGREGAFSGVKKKENMGMGKAGHHGRTPSSVHAPVYVPKGSISECQSCKTKFSLVKRKYHCTNCGLIFCNDCSKFKHDENRVCGACLKDLQRRKHQKMVALAKMVNTGRSGRLDSVLPSVSEKRKVDPSPSSSGAPTPVSPSSDSDPSFSFGASPSGSSSYLGTSLPSGQSFNSPSFLSK